MSINKRARIKKFSIKKIHITVLFIFICILGTFFLLGNTKTLSHTELTYKKEVVCLGETLWEISSREIKNNEYYLGKDIRYVIDDIKKINNLETSSLYSGQELLIPQM